MGGSRIQKASDNSTALILLASALMSREPDCHQLCRGAYTHMVSRIEPDRYADTGFAVKDTPPELKRRLFDAIMRKTPAERLMMSLDMMATTRELVMRGFWREAGEATCIELQRWAFQRLHRVACPWRAPEDLGKAKAGLRVSQSGCGFSRIHCLTSTKA